MTMRRLRRGVCGALSKIASRARRRGARRRRVGAVTVIIVHGLSGSHAAYRNGKRFAIFHRIPTNMITDISHDLVDIRYTPNERSLTRAERKFGKSEISRRRARRRRRAVKTVERPPRLPDGGATSSLFPFAFAVRRTAAHSPSPATHKPYTHTHTHTHIRQDPSTHCGSWPAEALLHLPHCLLRLQLLHVMLRALLLLLLLRSLTRRSARWQCGSRASSSWRSTAAPLRACARTQR